MFSFFFLLFVFFFFYFLHRRAQTGGEPLDGAGADRKSGGEGKSVDLGGRRIIKKKKNTDRQHIQCN